MQLVVVRHAHAGSKEQWHGDDALRPLTARGEAEAAALVDPLMSLRPRCIVSSPLVRCVQTVQPLADRLSLEIHVAGELGPAAGERAAKFLGMLSRKKGPIVVCTHGETIESLQLHLNIEPSCGFGVGGAHEKGSAWILGTKDGMVVTAEYLPPA